MLLILVVDCSSFILFFLQSIRLYLPTMVWVVVQWIGENSVSVINEKEINEEADLIKEGATVSVISKNFKGKAQIYQAVVQKVFGEVT